MMPSLKQLSQGFLEILERLPEIRYAGDPVLRQETQEVSLGEGLKIAKKLEKTLMTYRKIAGMGRGLAAPQIGESKSVFITFIDDVVEVFLNPKIIERASETNFYRELCLSSGIMSADVERPQWIVMEWMDASGEIRRSRFEGFKARLYQHEEAHLRGVLNLDEAVKGRIEFATFDPLKEGLRNK